MSESLDLTGQRFGRLVATRLAQVNPRKWNCLCDCGESVDVRTSKLRSLWTQSCGCLHRDVTVEAKTTHGMSKTPIYRVWQQMLRRCDLHTHEHYADYGGRGIVVCARWKTFANFYADMGEPPFKGASLDRRNNMGHYTPENVEWSTKVEQARNCRDSRLLTFRGVTKHISEWAEEMGINTKTLNTRVYQRGWTVERALTTGVRM